MNPVATLGIAIGFVVVVVIVVIYLRVYNRNRSMGTPGLISRSRLTCPKCHQTFDFDYLPGASLTSVRLGTSRYMACPLCHKWSTFDLSAARMPVQDSPPGSGPSG